MNIPRRNYYDDFYKDFGEQPEIIEINIGNRLVSLLDKENGSPLCKEIQWCRNKFDAELGLILPNIDIKESRYLEPEEYAFFLNGTEIARFTTKLGYYFCIDTGGVQTPIDNADWKKTTDPAFGMDAFIVPEVDIEMVRMAGYVCVPPERIISTHLYETIKTNVTRILNQSMVNELVEKVRKINPDVITDVFITKRFSISEMKIVLNRLLEEYVSIRDMNTILETIAEYLHEAKIMLDLAEKVRVKLASSFIKEYTEDGKIVHVIKISENVSEMISDKVFYPDSKIDRPYLTLDSADRKRLVSGVTKSVKWFTDHDLLPVFICVASIRPFVADFLHSYMPGVHVISDLEMYAAKNLTATLEGVLEFDD